MRGTGSGCSICPYVVDTLEGMFSVSMLYIVLCCLLRAGALRCVPCVALRAMRCVACHALCVVCYIVLHISYHMMMS